MPTKLMSVNSTTPALAWALIAEVSAPDVRKVAPVTVALTVAVAKFPVVTRLPLAS